MTQSSYDLVVFGATSFVGQILTRHLAEHLSSGADTLRWAIAGRSEAKLAQLRDSLGD
ncbi:saccharopine dehydrogenase, partial [Burkholderia multivorans]